MGIHLNTLEFNGARPCPEGPTPNKTEAPSEGLFDGKPLEWISCLSGEAKPQGGRAVRWEATRVDFAPNRDRPTMPC
jgi:hypothetical protein